jgi:hypothetical protein
MRELVTDREIAAYLQVHHQHHHHHHFLNQHHQQTPLPTPPNHLTMSDWNGPGMYRIEAGSKRSCRVSLAGGNKADGTKILCW